MSQSTPQNPSQYQRIILQVIKAKNLEIKSKKNSTTNPYVVLKISSSSQDDSSESNKWQTIGKTEAINKSLHPEWNSSFPIAVV